jgi:hypothetical protein
MQRADRLAANNLKRPLELKLHGALPRLLLPSAEASAVVFHYELNLWHEPPSRLSRAKLLRDLNRVKRRPFANVIRDDPKGEPVRNGIVVTNSADVNLIITRNVKLHRILLGGRVNDDSGNLA